MHKIISTALLLVGTTLCLQVQAQNHSPVEPAWYLDGIQAPEDLPVPSAERPLVIAIVDDGVRTSHRDLQGFVWRNPLEVPANGIDDDGNGYVDDVQGWDVADGDNTVGPPEDRTEEFYHGTHLAGIVTGIARRAYGDSASDQVRILPVKALSDRARRTYLKDGYKGIAYAIQAGADIIIAAWGVGYISPDEQRILQRAKQKGILVVAAAGNFPQGREEYPAAHESVLAVTALDREDRKVERSNYGLFVDLAAPGADIDSTGARSDTHYETRDGTSQSTAIVAAAAAIVRLQHPNYSWQEVTACLKHAADPFDAGHVRYIATLGAGKLNLRAAVECPLFGDEAGQADPLLHPQGHLYFDSRRGTSATWTIAPSGPFEGLRFRRQVMKGKAPEGEVEFYAGQSADGRLVGRYPLGNLPESVFVAGTAAYVVFKGEDAETPSRWLMEYRAEPIDFSRLYCRGTKHLDAEGEFDDGSGPNDYSFHSDCKWLITAPEGKVIRIRFSEFDTESKTDKVYFFDSTGTHQRRIMAIFSGPNIPPELTTWRNLVLVWFVTDGVNEGKGWRAEYRFVDP